MGKYCVISYKTWSFIVHNAHIYWVRNVCWWSPRVSQAVLFPFLLSSFTNGRPGVFLPRISQKKESEVLPLTNSSEIPSLEHPLCLKLRMVMKCVWLFCFLLTHIKLEEMAWSQRKTHNLALTLNFTFIFALSKESSLSFGNAALSSFSLLCLFLAAISWEQAW